ncbi:MAG: hypothetical protein U0228_16145 [Myxococcaceae bacterium]
MQALVRLLSDAAGGLDVRVHRAPAVVSVADNYDALGYPAGGAAREARWTRYVTADALLRTQTSAMVPPLLRAMRGEPPADVALVCPGLVYRRDQIDRLHVGEPHQVDVWRVGTRAPADGSSLRDWVAGLVGAVLPGREWRLLEARHPYTRDGVQVEVRDGEAWVEVGEAGVAAPELLEACAGAGVRGLASGWGLDRLLMLRKGLGDVRLLRSEDPRAQRQLLDLAPWRPLSSLPLMRRDLSLAVEPEEADVEVLGDRVREVLGDRAAWVEAVEIVLTCPVGELSEVARGRLGARLGQVNVLLRLSVRAVDRSLTTAEVNALRDDVYRALHAGDVA